jgi:predicted metal-dependent HD superfamily phosphohydrolase
MAVIASLATESRFAALWRRLGARRSPDSVYADLAARYLEAHRAYHTAEHLDHVLRELDRIREVPAAPDLVEAALWFHDAVYEPRRHDNEERSATLAEACLVGAGVGAGPARRVADLVRLTRRHDPPLGDADGECLCDCDLAILGQPPEAFAAYDAAIRREYAWVPEDVYRAGRRRVLEGFRARPQIFRTAPMRHAYEAAARANLARHLAL